MAKRSAPQTQAKRQREIAKKQKRQSKLDRRALRKQQKAEGDDDAEPQALEQTPSGPAPGQ